MPAPILHLSDSRLIRVLAASLIVGLALGGLWQAGVIFPETVRETAHDLQPARVDLDTPNVPGRAPGLGEGDIAPDFEFSTFDGGRQRLSDLRGQAVMLNFWATWCLPCRTEMPDMQTL